MASITANRGPAPSAAQQDSASSHPYTCNTCQVAFRNSELQRTHMRSDWHRYNLKRRVTSLPPISSEIFTEKVLQAQASTTEAASKAAFEKTCTVCARTYFSQNAYQNHVGSAKHKLKVATASNANIDDGTSSVMSSTFSLGEPMAVQEPLDSDAEDEFNEVVDNLKKTNIQDVPSRRPSRPHNSADAESQVGGSVRTASSVTAGDDETPEKVNLNKCLFCNYASPSVPLNANHMEKIHGMFIPERSYLVDLEGLITSLHEKIFDFHECLYCGKLKPSVFGLQTHMRDKGHCKIPFHTEAEQLEVGEFYDFRSTYSDAEDDDMSDTEEDLPGKKRAGGVKLGAKRSVKVADEDGDEAMEEGDGWETDSSESSLDSADLTAVPLDQREHQYEKLNQHPHHTHANPRPHHNKDGWHSHAHKHNHAVFYSEYELHLPSGRTAGHRSLNRYYRQNLHSYPTAAERHEQLAIEAAASSDEDVESREVGHRAPRGNNMERGRAQLSRAGGLGMVGVSEEKRREVQLAEKKARKMEIRDKRKQDWGVNKQNNFQKHFRDPLLQ